MLTSLSLHSIVLGVRDVDASLVFYTEKLGLRLANRFGDFALVDLAGASILLRAHVGPPPTARPPSVEIVLAVGRVRDAYEHLRANGVVFIDEPRTVDGTNDVVHFEDPDGHLLTLYGAP